MTDTRPTVTADTSTIDLAALDDMLGGHGLVAGDGIIKTADGSPVTQQELEAAVAAYVPPPPEPPAADPIALLPSALTGLHEDALPATTVAQLREAITAFTDAALGKA